MKIATQDGTSQEKKKTPKSVNKLKNPGIISNILYIKRPAGFFISEAFEISR